METAATVRKSPPGCRAQLGLQPLGPPCLSRVSAQPEGHGRSGPTRWICLQFYTSVFEDSEDDPKAGSSTRLRLPLTMGKP